jgi:hypothetical protein
MLPSSPGPGEGRSGVRTCSRARRRSDPEAVDDEACPRHHRGELHVDPERSELLRFAAHEEEAVEVTPVRLEEDGLDALDRTVCLQPEEVRHRLAEDLQGLRLSPPDGLTPADEETGVCHFPPPGSVTH